MSGERKSDGVLIVGAGIAGMAAGMHLAEVGERVVLLDSGAAIGGSMHLLDHTFPTNTCGVCLMLPRQPSMCPTLECERREGMELASYSELVGLSGEAGAYRARVRHKARYVDVDKCDGCGECGEVCPEARPHDHEGWGQAVKAIYRPAGQRAVPSGWVIDMGYCTRCGLCVEACPRGAVDLDMGSREEEVGVGAVLLAPGYGAFDARQKGEYGYGVYPNVMTSLEFERAVSLAGSRLGRIVRPSDGEVPRRVAFVQCVGSRDRGCGAGYCSSACCMYTAKQVAMAKKAEPGLLVTVYYMDVRAQGKGYEEYIAGVQGLAGVRYVRAMPSGVHQRERSKELVVRTVGEGGKVEEELYDLLVLAVGLAAPEGMQGVARAIGVELNGYGFAETEGYHAARTSRAGVYVAGAYREPKDIPETVVEAVAAAGEVAAFLRDLRALPPSPAAGRTEGGCTAAALRDVTDEAPRVGVFVCECNGALAPLDIGLVVDWAGALPGVAVARAVGAGCTEEGREAIRAAIDGEILNRVVVAGCGRREYADEWEAIVRGAGLDVRLLEVVPLREQVVYPHTGGPSSRKLQALGKVGALTSKAQSLVGMSVARMTALTGLEAYGQGGRQELERRALVVGGGAAGMSAALQMAGLGIPVELVERGEALGGQWREIGYQADGSDVQGALAEAIARVEGEERIRVHLGAEVAELGGKPGRYRSVLRNGREEAVEHGVVVVATGGRPAATREYLYGRHPAVITQRELEARLSAPIHNPQSKTKNVVMIQCVGSREPGRVYCSRVCCTQAVKNALKLKEVWPGVNVYVLYREVRTYGFRERYYEAAREAGVVFVRYELPEKPEVEGRGEKVGVRVRERVLGQTLEVEADLLVLSVGMEAAEEGELAGVLGVARDGDGYFREEHGKMKPLDLGKGMYVAGVAHSPQSLEEAIVQGQGAGLRAAAWLAGGEVLERATSVWVNERLCSFCGLCVEACPYGGRVMNYERRVAEVEYGQCQGCGVCAVVCPNKATKQKAYEQRQVMAAVDMALV